MTKNKTYEYTICGLFIVRENKVMFTIEIVLNISEFKSYQSPYLCHKKNLN